MSNQDVPVNPERSLTIRGHKIVVREVTMAELRPFVAYCKPFLKCFDESEDLKKRHETGRPINEFALFELLADNAELFMKAAEVVSNADYSFYSRLKPDEFFEVAATVVEVNGDFFIQRLAPKVANLVLAISRIGSTAFSSSSPLATDTETSSGTP